MSTLHYGDDHLAMFIDGVQRTNRVTGQRLIRARSALGLFAIAEADESWTMRITTAWLALATPGGPESGRVGEGSADAAFATGAIASRGP